MKMSDNFLHFCANLFRSTLSQTSPLQNRILALCLHREVTISVSYLLLYKELPPPQVEQPKTNNGISHRFCAPRIQEWLRWVLWFIVSHEAVVKLSAGLWSHLKS